MPWTKCDVLNATDFCVWGLGVGFWGWESICYIGVFDVGVLSLVFCPEISFQGHVNVITYSSKERTSYMFWHQYS